MPPLPKHEYERRRKLTPADMTGHELASWWDWPCEFNGRAGVEIGGKLVWIDFTKGSVPTVITRPYFPC